MYFKWDNFREYEDGSKSTRCRFKMYQDDQEINHGWIEDHTIPKQKEQDKDSRRDVGYAYVIHCNGFDERKLFEVFREHGFTNEDFGYTGYSTYGGICANEDPDNSPCSYVGTPKCSVYDVIDMLEEALCRQYYFDYDKELAEFKVHLDKRQAIMDECKEYLKEKELTKEGYTQDAIEANAQGCLDIANDYDTEIGD